MLAIADGYQISEAVPTTDGGLFTTLIDERGNEVGTVTRLANGTAQASVDDRGGVDWQNLLGRVSTFLDSVAAGAKQTSDQVRRIDNAVQGAVTGAKVGYSAPVDWKPFAVAGGVVALVIVVGVVASRKR